MSHFTAYELPFTHLSDRLHQIRQRLLHAMPDSAAIINAEFGSLEDNVAELPTELRCAQ